MSLKQGAALFNRPIVGGLDDRGVIVYGTDEEIRKTAMTILSEAPSTGFILGADCTLPTDIELDRIRFVIALLDELREV